MQVLCKATNGNAETFCSICGQGFVMFWDRQSRTERAAALREIQEALRHHHRSASGPEVHPTAAFPVPDWNGTAVHKDEDVSGSAPSWGF